MAKNKNNENENADPQTPPSAAPKQKETIPVAPVLDDAHYEALKAKKISAGLTKEQAETVVLHQREHDAAQSNPAKA